MRERNEKIMAITFSLRHSTFFSLFLSVATNHSLNYWQPKLQSTTMILPIFDAFPSPQKTDILKYFEPTSFSILILLKTSLKSQVN